MTGPLMWCLIVAGVLAGVLVAAKWRDDWQRIKRRRAADARLRREGWLS